jgi:hypothetical protein
MSQRKSRANAASSSKTVTLYVCRFCGKVGVGNQPSSIDFGGCTPPNNAHIFQQFELALKK